MTGADIGRSKSCPFRIEPRFGKVTEDGSEPTDGSNNHQEAKNNIRLEFHSFGARSQACPNCRISLSSESAHLGF